MLHIFFISISIFFTQQAHSYQYSFEPQNSNCDLALNYTYYNLCYSEKHKQALWAKHELTSDLIKGKEKRTNDFRSDNRVPDPVSSSDYRSSGFDRGHLVPAGDMRLNHESMSETFFMTNMSPQNPSFNSGIWNALEAGTRKAILSLGSAIIITAPVLLEQETYSYIWSHVSIPTYYYKIIYFYEAGLMKAYLIPNENAKGKKYYEFMVSVDEIENLTGFDFFSELPDDIEDELESHSL